MWFFKKKKEPEFNYQKELAFIHDNLRDSFLHIKHDMQVMKDWIRHLNDRDSTQHKKIEEIQKHLEGMNEVVAQWDRQEQIIQPQLQTPKVLPEMSTVLPQEREGNFNLVEELTDTQKSMFHRAGLLLKESGQEWIALKTLAGDLYPERVYDQVRSTTSEYVNVLVDNGLLDKKRRGKHTLISLTKKGQHYFQKIPPDTSRKEEIKEVRKKQKF